MGKQIKKAKVRLKTFENGKGAIQAERVCSENKYNFQDDAFALNDVPYDVALSIHMANYIATFGEGTVMRFLLDVYTTELRKYHAARKKEPKQAA
jgi:hypothetical protein